MLNARVTATAAVPRPVLPSQSPDGGRPEAALHARRAVLEPEAGVRVELDIYRGELLTPGTAVTGPAVIEDIDTTIFVPSQATCRLDEQRNYRLNV
jgi:N-methylhydantoinase A